MLLCGVLDVENNIPLTLLIMIFWSLCALKYVFYSFYLFKYSLFDLFVKWVKMFEKKKLKKEKTVGFCTSGDQPSVVSKHIIQCLCVACIILIWQYVPLPAPWHEGNENGYVWEEKDRGENPRTWQQHTPPRRSGLTFPHSRVTGGEGLRFLHPWVSTFIVCHTLSSPPSKDIIPTQLLSDANAPWSCLSCCLGRNKHIPALWLLDRVGTWGDIHSDLWLGFSYRANSQLALSFTFDPWWWNNYLAYITGFVTARWVQPPPLQAHCHSLGLLFAGQALTFE